MVPFLQFGELVSSIEEIFDILPSRQEGLPKYILYFAETCPDTAPFKERLVELGITYKEDTELAQAGFREMIRSGKYPAKLWD